jgi:hypothetical protein
VPKRRGLYTKRVPYQEAIERIGGEGRLSEYLAARGRSLNNRANWRSSGSVPAYVVREIEEERQALSARTPLALVPKPSPTFGLSVGTSDALRPLVQKLAVIYERRNEKEKEWETLKNLIDLCYRHLVGKTGRRQAASG